MIECFGTGLTCSCVSGMLTTTKLPAPPELTANDVPDRWTTRPRSELLACVRGALGALKERNDGVAEVAREASSTVYSCSGAGSSGADEADGEVDGWPCPSPNVAYAFVIL